jgi:hypothetical protein
MNDVQLLTPTQRSIDPDLLPRSIAELRPYVGVADKEDVDLSSNSMSYSSNFLRSRNL